MKFNNLVAVIAIVSMAVSAHAQTDGNIQGQPTQGVVIMNSNTNSNSNAALAQQQPVTVVEAAPVQDSKADYMRKARQNEEVKTEQKIVEKLEESRLREEQARAERLFGNKLDGQTAAPAPVVAPVVAAPVVVAEPIPTKQEEPKETVPTHVTIEKVEIVQPAPIAPIKEEKPVIEEASSSKMDLEEEKPVEGKDRFFIGGTLGAPNYDASNVKSNFGLGVSVGVILKTDWVIEGSFLYSNHSVDTYWQNPLYRDLDQYDLGIGAKYYILSGRLKPFLGGSATYIYRKYQDRVQRGNPWVVNNSVEETTHSVNAGITAGVDFALNDKIMLGAGLDYNFNIMNKQDFQSSYSIPSGVTPLEEIDYTVFKINAKMTF